MRKLKCLFLLLLYAFLLPAQEDKKPFWKDVQEFKKSDSLSFPGTDKILLIGSSSFTYWKDVQQYFPAYSLINRGFGGSSLTDVIYYANDIIIPYRPKQILVYCGENDIAGDSTVTGKIVFNRFKELYNQTRLNLGGVPIAYISMKPSPSRWHLKDKMIEGNRLIEKFLKKKTRQGSFISVWKAMLGADGKPIPQLFKQDMLHMNKDGYTIWQKIIEPYLVK
jgi:lysophospholipase L1-like esterase